MTPFPLKAYRTISGIMNPLIPKILEKRAADGKEIPDRVHERLGKIKLEKSDTPVIWFHGVSVGESLSLLPLIRHIHNRRSSTQILMTSGTVAAAELLPHRLPEGVIHQFAPVDTPQIAQSFLDHWQPSLGVFVESELWPNQILMAKNMGCKLALLSARITQKTVDNWERIPESAAYLLRQFDLVIAQDQKSADRLEKLGATIDGIANLKRTAPPLDVNVSDVRTLRRSIGDRAVILAASTHKGEEEIILSAFSETLKQFPDTLLIIAPRHKKRADSILDLCNKMGFETRTRSTHENPTETSQVFIADSMGEMGVWFTLANIAIMGGSLVPDIGGHNPLEPARLNCPVISGPNTHNFKSIYQDMLNCNATRIVDTPYDITKSMVGSITGQNTTMVNNASQFVRQQDEALEYTWSALLPFIPDTKTMVTA